jgi:hypothetical protein
VDCFAYLTKSYPRVLVAALLFASACRSKEGGMSGATGGRGAEEGEFRPTAGQSTVLRIEDAEYLRGPCSRGELEGWTPSLSDVSQLELALKKIDTELKNGRILQGVDAYVRQYTGVVVHGERQIRVNAVLKDVAPSNWRTSGECLLDGGTIRWTATFVPRLNEIFDFKIGGS